MTLRDTQESALSTTQKLEFSAAEIGALAHLYRGEVYRIALPQQRPGHLGSDQWRHVPKGRRGWSAVPGEWQACRSTQRLGSQRSKRMCGEADDRSRGRS